MMMILMVHKALNGLGPKDLLLNTSHPDLSDHLGLDFYLYPESEVNMEVNIT